MSTLQEGSTQQSFSMTCPSHFRTPYLASDVLGELLNGDDVGGHRHVGGVLIRGLQDLRPAGVEV